MSSKQDLTEKLADCIENIEISSQDTPEQETILLDSIDPVLLSKWPKTKPSKVPAIFLHQPTSLEKHVDKILKQNIKFYQPRQGILFTKIMCQTMSDHKSMVQYFDKHQLPYHTYGNPSKSKMKVVIKGLHSDVDLNKLKAEMKSVSIPVIRVHKMHTKEIEVHGKILVLAVVPNDEGGHTILKIKKLLGYDVTLEPPLPKKKQCYRCQKWGHSQRYCHGQQKCVKCAGDHNHKKCDKMDTSVAPKCANCGEDHTANYKNCRFSHYSDIYKTSLMWKNLNYKMNNKKAEIITAENKKKLYKNFKYPEDVKASNI